MARKIGISTGIFHKYCSELQLNERIRYISKLDVDIVELLFSRPFMLDIKLDKKNTDFLKTKSVVIHAPFFKDEGYEDVVYDANLIEKLIKKAKALNAEHLILHPDLLLNLNLIKDRNLIFAFENLKKNRISYEKLFSVLIQNPELKISLDLGHAKDCGKDEVAKYITNLKDRIVEVHFSVNDNYSDLLSDKLDNSYDVVKLLDCPIILESRPKNIKDIPLIIKKIRGFLEND